MITIGKTQPGKMIPSDECAGLTCGIVRFTLCPDSMPRILAYQDLTMADFDITTRAA